MDGSDMDGSDMDGSDMDGSDMDGSDMDGSDMDGSDMDGSDMDGSDMDGSDIDGSDMDGSDMDRISKGSNINVFLRKIGNIPNGTVPPYGSKSNKRRLTSLDLKAKMVTLADGWQVSG